jgi:hypothetical protein
MVIEYHELSRFLDGYSQISKPDIEKTKASTAKDGYRGVA